MATAERLAPDPGERILFASADLLVRHVTGGSGEICYVTFDSYTDHRTLDRPGFGEAFFRSRGLDAIHVVSRDNLWYQDADLPEALRRIAAVTAPYRSVTSYGSSMGGFAALHYGAACGADTAIALSPQYSVEPGAAPNDERWAHDVARIRFRRETTRPVASQYVVYDPCDRLDRAHFALFAARSPTIGVPVPHAGHPAGGYLGETGLLEPLIRQIREGSFDPPGFAVAARTGRRQSGHYFFTLSRRVPVRRAALRIALARAAVAANPGNPAYLSNLATMLDEVGQHGEAGPLHAHAVAVGGEGLHYRHAQVLHHEAVGDLVTARELVGCMLADFPTLGFLQRTDDRIRRRQRHARPIGRLAGRLGLDPLLDRLGRSRRGG